MQIEIPGDHELGFCPTRILSLLESVTSPAQIAQLNFRRREGGLGKFGDVEEIRSLQMFRQVGLIGYDRVCLDLDCHATLFRAVIDQIDCAGKLFERSVMTSRDFGCNEFHLGIFRRDGQSFSAGGLCSVRLRRSITDRRLRLVCCRICAAITD